LPSYFSFWLFSPKLSGFWELWWSKPLVYKFNFFQAMPRHVREARAGTMLLSPFSNVTTFSISGPLFIDSIASSIMKTCTNVSFTVQKDRKYLPVPGIGRFLMVWDFSTWVLWCDYVYSGHICFDIKH
jgi:hypothetical protein